MNDKIKAISTLFLIAVFCVLFAACSPAHNKSAEMSHDAYSHWYTCSECEEKLEKGDHVWVKGRTASCTAKATRKCSVCGYEEEIGKLHNLTFVEAKTATATTHGNIEYYQCEGGCGKKFADANGIIELTDEEVNTYVVTALIQFGPPYLLFPTVEADVEICKGTDSVAIVTCDENGVITAELQNGKYTLKLSGYPFAEFTVNGANITDTEEGYALVMDILDAVNGKNVGVTCDKNGYDIVWHKGNNENGDNTVNIYNVYATGTDYVVWTYDFFHTGSTETMQLSVNGKVYYKFVSSDDHVDVIDQEGGNKKLGTYSLNTVEGGYGRSLVLIFNMKTGELGVYDADGTLLGAYNSINAPISAFNCFTFGTADSTQADGSRTLNDLKIFIDYDALLFVEEFFGETD